MTLTANTLLDQIEIRPDGVIQLRFAKQLLSGNIVMNSSWHRSMLAPGDDLTQLVAALNNSLAGLGYPQLNAGDIEKIQKASDTFQTSDVVKAYQAAATP